MLDFGVAKDVSDGDAKLSGTQDITGMPLYMPPEAIMDPKLVDGRSDVYALGVVGHRMLTGTALLPAAPDRAGACWAERRGRARPQPAETLELARTMAIGRREQRVLAPDDRSCGLDSDNP